MPTIILKTEVTAPKTRVFDLSRSIDLHIASTKQSNETVVSPRKSGLLSLNESVTWRAKHLGFYQQLTSKITSFDYPIYFADEMQKGIFKSFIHQHHFKDIHNGKTTLMTDEFEYQPPLGVFGRITDHLFLKNYMTRLLIKRNEVIKIYAESSQWEAILGPKIDSIQNS